MARRGLVVMLAFSALGFVAHELVLGHAIAPRRPAPSAAAIAGTSLPSPSPLLAAAQARRARPDAELRPAVLPAGRAPLSQPLAQAAFMRRFADDVCRCTDSACAAAVDRYYAEHLGLMRHAPDDALRAHEEEKRANDCIGRLAHPS
jgi:hypothetical protein